MKTLLCRVMCPCSCVVLWTEFSWQRRSSVRASVCVRDRGDGDDGDDDDEWRKQRRATTRERRARTRPRGLCFDSMVAVSGVDVCPAWNAAPIAQAERTRRSRPHPHPRPAKPHQMTPESFKSPAPLIATDSITLRCIRAPEKSAEVRSLSGPDQVLCTGPTAPEHLSLPSLISRHTATHSHSRSPTHSFVSKTRLRSRNRHGKEKRKNLISLMHLAPPPPPISRDTGGSFLLAGARRKKTN